MNSLKSFLKFALYKLERDMITIYGIKNCDTMKKAFQWLDAKGISYSFHDYKKLGAAPEKLEQWLTKFDLWQLVNTKGSTWRMLDDAQKAEVRDAATAISLMLEKNSVIKRPLVELEDGSYLLGFDATEWEKKFKSN